MNKRTFKVDGMHCASCASSVETMLGAMEGVDQANVNFADESVFVQYDEGVISQQKMKEAVQKI